MFICHLAGATPKVQWLQLVGCLGMAASVDVSAECSMYGRLLEVAEQEYSVHGAGRYVEADAPFDNGGDGFAVIPSISAFQWRQWLPWWQPLRFLLTRTWHPSGDRADHAMTSR
tara:strand:- start:86 stop:427 length:342 start_codon:yes stop_codon:yes gene_type:complete